MITDVDAGDLSVAAVDGMVLPKAMVDMSL
jgi:hypothetical protein